MAACVCLARGFAFSWHLAGPLLGRRVSRQSALSKRRMLSVLPVGTLFRVDWGGRTQG